MGTVVYERRENAARRFISVARKYSARSIALAVVLILLSAAYCWYAYLQRSNIFFESQFLHIDFLKSLADNNLTERSFFTRFGEHLLPGYNLLLAINYYLFGVWGHFDGVVHLIVSISAAAVVAWQLHSADSTKTWLGTLSIAAVCLMLLSTVNNISGSMALAAHVGTFLVVLVAMMLERDIGRELPAVNKAVFFLIPLNILCFTAGYGPGFVAAVLVASIAWALKDRRAWKPAGQVAIVVIASVLLYVFILLRQGPLFAGGSSDVGVHALDVVQFAILMAGASVLGTAYLEEGHTLSAYYVCGAILWIAALWLTVLLVRRALSNRLEKNDVFLGMLLCYSLTTIVMVSIARVGINGIAGGLGQWYNSHTRFLPAVVCFYLLNVAAVYLAQPGMRRLVAGIPAVLFASLLVYSALGYLADFRKAPHVAIWKHNFVLQAPALLATVKEDADRSDPFQTMLWRYDATKAGLIFLYEHKFWMFGFEGPLVLGVEGDGWMVAGRDVTVLCPAGTGAVEFMLWRKVEWPAASVTTKTNSGSVQTAITNQRVTIPAVNGIAAVVLSGSDTSTSLPQASSTDQRPLIAIVNGFDCRPA